MVASLQLLDAEGDLIDLSSSNPIAFGTVNAGSTGGPTEIRVTNVGDTPAYFVTVRSVQHPAEQVGAAEDTFEAVELSTAENGHYEAELEVGTLQPGEELPVWLQWIVPSSAPAGAVVWAIEALGSET